MPRSKAALTLASAGEPIRGAELTPVRVVRRELVSPDGSVVVVDVPVYPPFRLARQEGEGEERTASA